MTNIKVGIPLYAIAVMVLPFSEVLAGGITIDGQTATSVTSTLGGGVRVNIAPSDVNGRSRNTYKDFNVGKAGVKLNNNSAKAKVIINEVTSSRRSRIQGKIEVEGNKADVVLANPNGITVNGGSFVNTGRGVLVTGRSNGSGADGAPRFAVTNKDVTIESDGLASAIDELSIYAGKLSINGALTNSNGVVNLSAGSGNLDVDSSSPLGWFLFNSDATSSGTIVLSSGSTLSGGSVMMTATGKGAGVNILGSGLASAGGYSITSDGNVVINGKLEAEKTVFVDAASINLSGSSSKKVVLKSNAEAVQLFSSETINGNHFDLQGSGRGFESFATNAAVSLRSSKEINLNNSTISAKNETAEVISESKVDISESNIQSDNDIILSADNSVNVKDVTLNTQKLALIESSDGEILTETSIIEAVNGIRLQGNSVKVLSSRDFRSRVEATSGGVTLNSQQDITTSGVLIIGNSKTQEDAQSRAGVTINAAGNYTNTSISQTSLGSIFSKGEGLEIAAGKNLYNISGRLLSDDDVKITVSDELKNSVLQLGEEIQGLNNGNGKNSQFGSYAIGREIGQITAGGKAEITSNKFSNLGGDVSADSLVIKSETFINQPERFGSFNYKKRCILILCRAKSRSSISHDGGTIVSSGALSITATDKLENTGGTIRSGSGINLTSPSIRFKANTHYDYYNRPSGISGLFSGKSSRRFFTYENGSLETLEGQIVLESENRTLIEATNIIARVPIQAANGVTIEEAPASLGEENRENIGFFDWLLQ